MKFPVVGRKINFQLFVEGGLVQERKGLVDFCTIKKMPGLVTLIKETQDASKLDFPITLQVIKVSGIKTGTSKLYKIELLEPGTAGPHMLVVAQKERFPVENPESIEPGTIIVIQKLGYKVQNGKDRVVVLSQFSLEPKQSSNSNSTSTVLDPPKQQPPHFNQAPRQPVQQQFSRPPVNSTASSSSTSAPSSAQTFKNPPAKSSPNVNQRPPQHNNNQRSPSQPKSTTDLSQRPSVPIVALTPWLPDWTIKARVTQKNDLKTWEKEGRSGCLFSITLIDESGSEIRGTFFNAPASKWHNEIKERGVYYFKGGKVKQADKRFSKIPHDYEIAFSDNCIVQPVSDVESRAVPQGHFEFITFDQLKDCKKDKVDIVGVIQKIGEPTSVTIKPKPGTDEKEKLSSKRDVHLLGRDASGGIYEIPITLWGEKEPTFQVGDAVIFAGASLKTFRDSPRLNANNSTRIIDNLDLPERISLLESFPGPVDQYSGTKLNTASEFPARSFKKRQTLEDLDDITVEDLDQEKEFHSKTLFIRSHLMMFKGGDLTYEACPNEDCKGKKLKKDELDGTLKCSSCGNTPEYPLHRYMTSVMLTDYTGHKWLTAFDSGIAALLGGTPADQFASMTEQEKADLMGDVQFKCATYRVRASIQQGRDNPADRSVRYAFSGFSEIDWEKEAKGALATIRAYGRTFK